jgi:tape measure domain-containing protein
VASLGDVTVELDLDIDDFRRNLSRMRKQLDGLSSQVKKGTNKSFGGLNDIVGNLGGRLGSLRNMFTQGLGMGVAQIAVEGLVKGFIALGQAIKNTITEGIKYNASMEQNTVAFEVMLGSMKEAKSLMKDIQDFADITPFSTEGLVQGVKVMKQFGIETEKLMPNIRMLGDIALGDSEKLSRLTLAFSQIQSTGKLMGQDLLQLINAGFNPLQTISEETGKSMAELKEMMSDGAISADLVQLAFQRATSEGGRFYNGTEKLGKSWDGLISTIKDTSTKIKGALIKPFQDWLKANILPKIQKMLDKLLKVIPKMFAGIKTFYNTYVKPVWESWKGALSEAWEAVKELGKVAGVVFKAIWVVAKPIIDALLKKWAVMSKNMAEKVKIISSAIKNFLKIVQNVFGLIKNVITGNWKGAFDNVENITQSFKNFFKDVFRGMGRIVYNWANAFVDVFEGLGINIEAIFVNVFQWLIDKYNAFVGKLNDLNDITIGGGTIFGKKIPEYTIGLPDIPKLDLDVQNEVDYVKGYIKDLLGITNAFEENTEAGEDNAKMSEEGINWAELFGKELNLAEKDAKSLNKVMEDLTKTIKDQAKSFANFVGIFDKVKKVRVSAKSLFHRLKGQVKEMEKWQNAVTELKRRLGADSALFQEIVKKGPAAAGETAAIAGMSDEMLAEYQNLFDQKIDKAVDTALATNPMTANMKGISGGGITVNITGNNINDSMDVDIIADRMANKLKLVGVQ